MPSKDKINPKANDWMADAGIVTDAPVSSKPKKEPRVMAAQVQRIARRLGKKPDEIANTLPADTLRRLKYPVLEHRDADGKRTFKHDLGITEGPNAR